MIITISCSMQNKRRRKLNNKNNKKFMLKNYNNMRKNNRDTKYSKIMNNSWNKEQRNLKGN